MSIPVRSLRLLPKPKAELDRLSGNRGEIFYDSTSKSLRIFDGVILGGTLLNASVTVAITPPANPTQGSLWFNSSNGSLYIYYQDINSNQWVTPIVPAGLIGSGGGGIGASTTLNNLGTTAINSSLIPSVDNAVDLGTSSKKWKDLYINGSVYLNGATISSTGNVVNLPAGSTVGGTAIGAGGVTSINELSDVDTATVAPTNGQALVWNSSVSNWRPGTVSGGGSGNSFTTLTVAGQSDVVADSASDILTLVGGTGITITTTPGSDTITFTNSGIPNSFATISVAGQSSVVADSSTDTLTLAAGTGITLTTNATTDTITIASGFNQSLNTTDNVVFGSVTATTLTSNGVGTPTYTSAGDFIFTTGNSLGALVLNGDLEVTGTATLGNLGVANGIASLGADGKLTASQIPSSLTGAVVFKGTWNATTNTPTLADGAGSAGWQYAVSVGGTRNLGSGSVVFVSGDSVIYNGTIWQRIPASTVAEASTLTGATLASNVLSSSLTSVGTLLNLTVTNAITGSITGNAGTVTNGVYTNGTYSNPAWITSLAASKVGLGNVTNESKATMFSSPTFSGTVTLGAVGNVSITGGTNGYVLSTNGSGTLSWVAQTSGGTYTLPTATGSVLGGIKIGTGLSIDGNGVVSAAGGATTFTGLSDIGSAGLTVDKIYLPAITRLNVTTPVFNYNIDQYSGDNPAIYAISGTTIAFNLQQSSSHPFLLQQNNANITTANLIHVSTAGIVSTGSSAQGKYEGTLYWKIPSSVSGTFRYICSVHTSMVGSITIKDISTI